MSVTIFQILPASTGLRLRDTQAGRVYLTPDQDLIIGVSHPEVDAIDPVTGETFDADSTDDNFPITPCRVAMFVTTAPEVDPQALADIARCMHAQGGSFAAALGQALTYADGDNTRRILAAFPDLIDKYATPT